MIRSSLLLLFFAATGAQGCSSTECTLIGCADLLQISFSGGNTVPGRYQIEVVADGVPGACQITLPHGCNTETSCMGGTTNWQWMVAGCEPGSRQSIAGFRFYKDPPASLDFIVRRDGIVVGGGSAQPVYKESRPNGPECEPVCRQAPNIDVELAP